MNLNNIKRFATKARNELKEQVRGRLSYVLERDTAELRGLAKPLEDLRKRIQISSEGEVVEEVAYTWFNR
ncbi:MAG: class I SAM-dependent DNA methyltransferase, partial [Deltaproteobacteria bacterium]|nr:class I SAM-dependent DNA methyltransferase [Deltaproteobacteria bacterium]